MVQKLDWNIKKNADGIEISAGILQRILQITPTYLQTSQLSINNSPLNDIAFPEIALQFYIAIPDERPKGISPNVGARNLGNNSN